MLYNYNWFLQDIFYLIYLTNQMEIFVCLFVCLLWLRDVEDKLKLSETFYFQHKILFPDKSIPTTRTLVDFLEMKVEFGIEEAEI